MTRRLADVPMSSGTTAEDQPAPELDEPQDLRGGLNLNPTRRELLAVSGALVLGIVPLSLLSETAYADDPTLDDSSFLTLSKAATGSDVIDPVVSARLFDALKKADPTFASRATALRAMVREPTDCEALLAAAGAAGLRDTMLALVAAWYTGSVGPKNDGQVVAYADSLMYRPISDAMTAPTYCANGPLWWTGDPPPLIPPPNPKD
jgi:hypothetical protein